MRSTDGGTSSTQSEGASVSYPEGTRARTLPSATSTAPGSQTPVSLCQFISSTTTPSGRFKISLSPSFASPLPIKSLRLIIVTSLGRYQYAGKRFETVLESATITAYFCAGIKGVVGNVSQEILSQICQPEISKSVLVWL